jgi:ATP-binding cassette subfamily C protein CydC
MLPLLAVFVLASFEAVMPLPAALQKAGEMAAAARRLFSLIDEPPAVVEPGRPLAPPRASAGGGIGIEVRGLRFRYAPDGPAVLDGFSLAVAPGRRVAIMGPTGAGKSTLVAILLRFWDYEAGSVLVAAPGGPAVELRDLSGQDARGLFSVLPQSPHLFHATLRENLQVAAPDGRDFDDAALVAALEAAQLGTLLAALPDGLDTVVGETGRELSVGEGRRVALARALLRDTPAYILDEPT